MQAHFSGTQRGAGHLSALLHQIYDAAVHPERWNDVVAAVAHSLGTDKGLLFTPYVAPQHGGLIFPAGISEETLQTWGSSYIDHDIWAQDLLSKNLWRTGAVLLDDDITATDEFLSSRFYTEFLSKIGIGRVCVGLVFGGESGMKHTTMAFFRAYDARPFDQSDRDWLQLLVSHVSRALGVMQRLDTERLQRTSLLASFDRLAFGVALLNEHMQVLHLNQPAQAVLERNDGLVINAERRLESVFRGRSNQRLSTWLRQACSTPREQHSHFLDAFSVARKDPQRHYLVQYSEIAPSAQWSVDSSLVRHVAFIVDPASLRLPSPERLVELFDLTRMQALVALEFAQGGTYGQVGRKLGITEETVRSHVRELYPKTRVNRQADLVRLVLSLGQCAV